MECKYTGVMKFLYKYGLFLSIIAIGLSCSDGKIDYIASTCQMKIKSGSTFTLYTQLGDSTENLIFENDTILWGNAICFPELNEYRIQVENINRYFVKSKIMLDDLTMTFVNDSLKWISTNSDSNFSFGNIDYYMIDDSIFHFKCYGEGRNWIYAVSTNNKEIRLNVDFEIRLIN